MEILNQFGINPVLLLAQVVNFLVLLFILKRFLYKPILKVLEERKKRIEESLKNAEEIEMKLQEITEKEEEVILKAGKEGQKIIAEAQMTSSQIIDNANKAAEQILAKAIEDSKKLIELERSRLMSQVRDNLSDIVLLGLQKVLGRKATQEQKKIVEEVLKES